jgi:hypothetical protein
MLCAKGRGLRWFRSGCISEQGVSRYARGDVSEKVWQQSNDEKLVQLYSGYFKEYYSVLDRRFLAARKGTL